MKIEYSDVLYECLLVDKYYYQTTLYGKPYDIEIFLKHEGEIEDTICDYIIKYEEQYLLLKKAYPIVISSGYLKLKFEKIVDITRKIKIEEIEK